MKKLIILGISIVSSITFASNIQESILKSGRKYKGTPYLFGGTDIASGIDCSAFVQTVMGWHGIKLPRTARQQYAKGRAIYTPEKLQPADLVFFQTYRPGASHVGIYADVEKQFLHAASSRGISESTLKNPWWGPRYLGARRVLSDSQVKLESESSPKPIPVPPKTVIKPKKRSSAELKKQVATISNFQKKQRYLKKYNNELKKIDKWLKKNNKVAKKACPVVYKNSLKTYLYDPSYKPQLSKKNLKFGDKLILVGGSKPKSINGKSDVAYACVMLPNNTLDLIDARAISVFPPTGLVDPGCKSPLVKKGKVKIKRYATPLELNFFEFENVFGDRVRPNKIKAKFLKDGKVLKSHGTIRFGQQAGHHCVEYKGNVYSVYQNDLKEL